MAPFWAVPSETMPKAALGLVVGIVNAFGNLGGFAGPFIAGWLSKETGNIAASFTVLGAGMLVAAGLAFRLPKAVAVTTVAATTTLSHEPAAKSVT